MSNPLSSHRPRRRFGQNFLVDRSYIDRIVAAVAPERDDAVLEIGPGQGAITAPLLERLDRLYAVEIDRDLARSLGERFAPERLVLFCEDALEFDYARLPEALRVVGNLTTPDGKLAPPDLVKQVGIGPRVRMVFSDVGDGMSLPQWTLDETAQQPASPWRYPGG